MGNLVAIRVPWFDDDDLSAAQRDRREKMCAATVFARAINADPAAKAISVAADRDGSAIKA